MKKQAEYIKRIEIKGLWGRKNIAWDLRPDVNILSGVNGIGKSTILNNSVRRLSDLEGGALSCLLYTSPSQRDPKTTPMPSSA